MEWIQTLLAGFLDKFKAKNPIQYAVIAVILISLSGVYNNAIEWNLIDPEALKPWMDTSINILENLVLVLLGSRTVKYMSTPAQLKIMDKMEKYD